jgi:Protein of unknown function (DUF3025)
VAHGLEAINWQAPWLAHCCGMGEPLARQVALGQSVRDVLNETYQSPVRFVAQCDLPQGQAYEQFIFDTASVPTRDNLHDFFNGLCWVQFPQSKRRLNALQAEQIAAAGIQPVRGPVRDALTLFDENAALLRAPQALWGALIARDWQRLFIDLRPLWAQAQLVLFGHALLEKLVSPRKAVTAHVYLAQDAPDLIANWDVWLAHDLSAVKLATKPFVPLPVLGVPHWWATNLDPDFYSDTQVFRAPRKPTSDVA